MRIQYFRIYIMYPGVKPPEYDRRIREVVSKSPQDSIGMTLMVYLLYAAPQLTNLCFVNCHKTEIVGLTSLVMETKVAQSQH